MNRRISLPDNLSPQCRRNLETILSVCLRTLPEDAGLCSVIFTGGAARGETGHFGYEERTIPFGDYDLEILLSRPLLDREYESVRDSLNEATGFDFADPQPSTSRQSNSPRFPVLDLRFQTVDEFVERSGDLRRYDLKQHSVVLWGEDCVSGLEGVSPEEISIFTPWRILGNRIVSALDRINTEFWDRKPTVREVMLFRLAVCRVYLDLAGMIGFVHGEYQTFFEKRVGFLKGNHGLWRSWFPNVEEFLTRVEKSFQFKRAPRVESWDGSRIFSEWFDLVYDLGRALPHLINLVLITKRVPLPLLIESLHKAGDEGRKAGAVREPFREDWRSLVRAQLRAYPGLFFRDTLERCFRRKGKRLPFSNFLTAQASRYYGVLEHLLWRGRKWVLRNLRRATLSPSAFQSAVLPLLLFSLSPRRDVDLGALDFFDPLMEPYMVMPFDFLPPLQRWEATKRCFVHEMLAYQAAQ